MRLLFTLDAKDYTSTANAFVRPSARAILLQGDRVAMIHSQKHNYYKFPGGGIEPGESMEEALVRESLEEAGLVVRPDTIRPYGYVHRIQKGRWEDVFIQDSYYFLCEAEEAVVPQILSGYEIEERYTLEVVPPALAIATNRANWQGPHEPLIPEREARVLECLLQEGYFTKG